MNRRAKGWLLGALLFTAVNLVGGVYAAILGESGHAGLHFGLTFLGAYAAWRLATRARGDALPAPRTEEARLDDARLDQLQQSVDAVAIEVERLGEAQRFNAKLQGDRSASRP